MGNHIPRCGKVILSDGSVVQELDTGQPVTVAELMLDHPQHFVAEFDEAKTNRPAPLPADQTLHTNKVYVMIPFLKQREIAIPSSSSTHTVLTKSAFHSCSPWMCPTAVIGVGTGGRRRRRKEFVLDKVEERKSGSSSSLLLLEGMDHGRPWYLNTQISANRWKPTLDTITESTVEEKIPHWLFSSPPAAAAYSVARYFRLLNRFFYTRKTIDDE